MAGFYVWETADLGINLIGENPLDGYEHIVVSISQPGIKQIDVFEDNMTVDLEQSRLNIRLEQEQTAGFSGGTRKNPRKAVVQVNIYYTDTERDTTAQGEIDVYDNLYKKLMPNE